VTPLNAAKNEETSLQTVSNNSDELADLDNFLDTLSETPVLKLTKSFSTAAEKSENLNRDMIFADDTVSLQETKFSERGYLLSSGKGLIFTPDAGEDKISSSFSMGNSNPQDSRSKQQTRFGNNLSLFGFKNDQVRLHLYR
jgi:hypothetical protein